MNSGNRPAYLVFFGALALNAALAGFIRRPGYMDAYYYFGGAQRLVRGFGFTEPYLWNYLDNPASLPHPSHLYWMPLTSIVAALPMWACGPACPDNASLFRAAQIPSVLLASVLPVIALWLARQATREAAGASGSTDPALILASAWFALFAGFYVVFWANTDSFALYGVVGSLALVCTGLGVQRRSPVWLGLAGVLAGLAHLTRADGILLLGVVLWFAPWVERNPVSQMSQVRSAAGTRNRVSLRAKTARAAASLGGYLLVMLPWFARNLRATGSPLAPGGSQALWFISYNDLFNFPADLSLASYLQAGWGAILAGKWEAVRLNAQTAIAVHGLVALGPFMVIGLWHLRRHPLFRPAILYALGLYFFMTFVFTFPGPRGGLFHSGAALMPFFAAAAPVGLDRAVRWAARRRPGWRAPTATRVFLAGLAVIVAVMSLGLFASRVVGPDLARPAWNRADEVYGEIAEWLARSDDRGSPVAVNNPPGFYFFSGRSAIVVPNGDVTALLGAADRFDAGWVILDANVPDALRDFYEGRERSDRLALAEQFQDDAGRPVYLFRVAR